MTNTIIRVEATTPNDASAIETLLDLSFGLARQTKTSYRLREGNRPIPGLSLVVRDDEVGLSGTISFWPLKIGENGSDALLLGPLAVHPGRQNLGIGLALMREGLTHAARLGHRLV
jgi:predicted N-acetyltransferase YhbS